MATVLGGQAGCAALALIAEVCYARLLGPEGRGQISLCMMVISLGILIGGLGGDVPIVIWTANAPRTPRSWLPATLIWGLLGCGLADAVWALTYWFWRPSWLRGISPTLSVIIVLTIPVTVLAGYLNAVLAGASRFRARAGVALADQLAGVVGFVTLIVLWGKTTETAMVGNLVGLAIGVGLAAALIKDLLQVQWRLQWPDAEIRAGLSMGLRGQLGNFASLFYYRLDVFFVNYFLGSAQVGLYALGVIVSEALWQVPQAVAAALFPRTARTLDEGAAEFTCSIMRLVFVISCALGLCVALISPLAVPLIFGERFRPSVAVIWLILPGTIALSLAKVACADLAGRLKNGYSSVCALVALAVSVGLDVILIPRAGIQGAALASSGAYLVDALLILWALKHQMKVGWRALLVPAPTEFESYRRVFLRYLPWFRPASVSANGSS